MIVFHVFEWIFSVLRLLIQYWYVILVVLIIGIANGSRRGR